MQTLRLSCDDKPGIVAAVATALSNCQCNIENSAQFHDTSSNQFYMRLSFTPLIDKSLPDFTTAFSNISNEFQMTWQICDAAQPLKTIIMVSQHDHCLNDLLYRYRSGLLPIDITAVISNHETTKKLVESHNIPYHYLPITKDTKAQQESEVRNIIKDTNSELIVMARYMQILSEEFCHDYQGRVINIHHSFLPSFKGAKPYHQAYERGVKIIGATAHFATADLDEGPIITQQITPVDHSHTPQKMQAMGRDTESLVLAKAVSQYAERRIFLNGKRTIIL